MNKITLDKLQAVRKNTIAYMERLDKLKGIPAMETFENIQGLDKAVTKEEYLKMKEEDKLCHYNIYKHIITCLKEEIDEYITKLEILAGVRNG